MDSAKKRRTSILKASKERAPLSDLTSEKDEGDTKRVSFAPFRTIKQFTSDVEQNTIWNSTYEESRSDSSEDNHSKFTTNSVFFHSSTNPGELSQEVLRRSTIAVDSIVANPFGNSKNAISLMGDTLLGDFMHSTKIEPSHSISFVPNEMTREIALEETHDLKMASLLEISSATNESSRFKHSMLHSNEFINDENQPPEVDPEIVSSIQSLIAKTKKENMMKSTVTDNTDMDITLNSTPSSVASSIKLNATDPKSDRYQSLIDKENLLNSSNKDSTKTIHFNYSQTKGAMEMTEVLLQADNLSFAPMSDKKNKRKTIHFNTSTTDANMEFTEFIEAPIKISEDSKTINFNTSLNIGDMEMTEAIPKPLSLKSNQSLSENFGEKHLYHTNLFHNLNKSKDFSNESNPGINKDLTQHLLQEDNLSFASINDKTNKRKTIHFNTSTTDANMEFTEFIEAPINISLANQSKTKSIHFNTLSNIGDMEMTDVIPKSISLKSNQSLSENFNEKHLYGTNSFYNLNKSKDLSNPGVNKTLSQNIQEGNVSFGPIDEANKRKTIHFNTSTTDANMEFTELMEVPIKVSQENQSKSRTIHFNTTSNVGDMEMTDLIPKSFNLKSNQSLSENISERPFQDTNPFHNLSKSKDFTSESNPCNSKDLEKSSADIIECSSIEDQKTWSSIGRTIDKSLNAEDIERKKSHISGLVPEINMEVTECIVPNYNDSISEELKLIALKRSNGSITIANMEVTGASLGNFTRDLVDYSIDDFKKSGRTTMNMEETKPLSKSIIFQSSSTNMDETEMLPGIRTQSFANQSKQRTTDFSETIETKPLSKSIIFQSSSTNMDETEMLPGIRTQSFANQSKQRTTDFSETIETKPLSKSIIFQSSSTNMDVTEMLPENRMESFANQSKQRTTDFSATIVDPHTENAEALPKKQASAWINSTGNNTLIDKTKHFQDSMEVTAIVPRKSIGECGNHSVGDQKVKDGEKIVKGLEISLRDFEDGSTISEGEYLLRKSLKGLRKSLGNDENFARKIGNSMTFQDKDTLMEKSLEVLKKSDEIQETLNNKSQMYDLASCTTETNLETSKILEKSAREFDKSGNFKDRENLLEKSVTALQKSVNIENLVNQSTMYDLASSSSETNLKTESSNQKNRSIIDKSVIYENVMETMEISPNKSHSFFCDSKKDVSMEIGEISPQKMSSHSENLSMKNLVETSMKNHGKSMEKLVVEESFHRSILERKNVEESLEFEEPMVEVQKSVEENQLDIICPNKSIIDDFSSTYPKMVDKRKTFVIPTVELNKSKSEFHTNVSPKPKIDPKTFTNRQTFVVHDLEKIVPQKQVNLESDLNISIKANETINRKSNTDNLETLDHTINKNSKVDFSENLLKPIETCQDSINEPPKENPEPVTPDLTNKPTDRQSTILLDKSGLISEHKVLRPPLRRQEIIGKEFHTPPSSTNNLREIECIEITDSFDNCEEKASSQSENEEVINISDLTGVVTMSDCPKNIRSRLKNSSIKSSKSMHDSFDHNLPKKENYINVSEKLSNNSENVDTDWEVERNKKEDIARQSYKGEIIEITDTTIIPEDNVSRRISNMNDHLAFMSFMKEGVNETPTVPKSSKRLSDSSSDDEKETSKRSKIHEDFDPDVVSTHKNSSKNHWFTSLENTEALINAKTSLTYLKTPKELKSFKPELSQDEIIVISDTESMDEKRLQNDLDDNEDEKASKRDFAHISMRCEANEILDSTPVDLISLNSTVEELEESPPKMPSPKILTEETKPVQPKPSENKPCEKLQSPIKLPPKANVEITQHQTFSTTKKTSKPEEVKTVVRKPQVTDSNSDNSIIFKIMEYQKSKNDSFIRRLLPDEWKFFFFKRSIILVLTLDPYNKDDNDRPIKEIDIQFQTLGFHGSTQKFVLYLFKKKSDAILNAIKFHYTSTKQMLNLIDYFLSVVKELEELLFTLWKLKEKCHMSIDYENSKWTACLRFVCRNKVDIHVVNILVDLTDWDNLCHNHVAVIDKAEPFAEHIWKVVNFSRSSDRWFIKFCFDISEYIRFYDSAKK